MSESANQYPEGETLSWFDISLSQDEAKRLEQVLARINQARMTVFEDIDMFIQGMNNYQAFFRGDTAESSLASLVYVADNYPFLERLKYVAPELFSELEGAFTTDDMGFVLGDFKKLFKAYFISSQIVDVNDPRVRDENGEIDQYYLTR